MPTTRFESTINALKEGAQKLTTEKAVANIEGWEDYLSKHDHEGVKAVVADLGKLKKMLQGGNLDGAKVKELLHKLGKDTVKVAGTGETAAAGKMKELGQMLESA